MQLDRAKMGRISKASSQTIVAPIPINTPSLRRDIRGKDMASVLGGSNPGVWGSGTSNPGPTSGTSSSETISGPSESKSAVAEDFPVYSLRQGQNWADMESDDEDDEVTVAQYNIPQL